MQKTQIFVRTIFFYGIERLSVNRDDLNKSSLLFKNADLNSFRDRRTCADT